ncbi:acyltransferase, partial [Nitratireductor sp. ZSWI3]|uniref:acyltransferase family protein n=1 Tax=Nitratireductor sp. ZSWI3 TaxID=2966359 RepID=UPI00214FAC14
MTIGEAFAKGRNNFDLIRLFAAALVLFSHSYPITGNTEFFKSIIRYSTGGGLAVAVFFAISGFLVTRSVLSHDIGKYVASRCLRIFPALAAVAVFQVFLIGPMFTSLPLDEYFGNPRTADHLMNATAFYLHYGLPGVFEDLPNGSVNGSLWTLPLETFCYIVLPFLAVLGALRIRSAWLIGGAVVVGYLVAVHYFGLNDWNKGPRIAKAVDTYSILRNGSFFAVGAMLWVYRERLPLSWGYWSLALVLAIIGFGSFVGTLGFVVAVSYGAILIALRTPAVRLPGDVSYGLYLYAYPVQQSVVAVIGAGIGATLLSAVALPIALCLACASWCYIEKPALEWRKRLMTAS